MMACLLEPPQAHGFLRSSCRLSDSGLLGGWICRWTSIGYRTMACQQEAVREGYLAPRDQIATCRPNKGSKLQASRLIKKGLSSEQISEKHGREKEHGKSANQGDKA